MKDLGSNVGGRYSARQVSVAVEAQLQTPGEVLSLPIPVEMGGRIKLGFFSYAVRGRTLLAPTSWVTAPLTSLRATSAQFTRARPEHFGYDVAPGSSIGEAGEPKLPDHEQDQAAGAYCDAVDILIGCYLQEPRALSPSERSAAEQYHSLFESLVPEPLQLAYRSLNPEFYRWIEAIAPDGKAAGGAQLASAPGAHSFHIDEATCALPKGWKDQSITILLAPTPGGQTVSLIITREDVEATETAKACADRQTEMLSAQLAEFRLSSRGERTIDGVPAEEVEFTWSSDKGQMVQKQVYLVRRQRALIFTASALESDAADCRTALEELLAGLKFRKE